MFMATADIAEEAAPVVPPAATRVEPAESDRTVVPAAAIESIDAANAGWRRSTDAASYTVRAAKAATMAGNRVI